MAPLSTFFGAALLLASSVSAHYSLLIPKPLGTDDEQQGSGPCGGYTPDFSKNTVSDFHVGGSNVGMRLGHPQATWLFRGTLDKTGQNNWTQLFPHVTQSGLGNFCEPSIPAPESWAGKEGIIGVVGKAEDGLLFTCAAVKFVTGVATLDSSNCKNGSAEAQLNGQDSQLAPLATLPSGNNTSGTGTGTGSGSGSGTSNGGGAATTDKPKNAAGVLSPNFLAVAAVAGLGFASVL
ncbi:hypothetical protein MCOR27_002134 [Pyricularia oryzae]|uniref:Copper acquisition factor BIM1-like domain-containing protein n=2 Tax=Pyricularia TaxID=48558 RepID=A0ABQ8N9Q1_PYRGI|nr:hypothetical protein MCOR01_000015 [Pyricularia oryzae]KAI6293588.1 hypothetical protein MCOR33_009043 [Pyricularia grisea]KAH9428286.1 hypothetical protein MCOR02_011771 [Pyricularia oryzae]KAI6254570.1 hypothetical protein MCOR19_008933 [Pyricularia oryzae]KAI6271699.1 hypothetical protein MCOR26_007699 [Pyricularia oryzae]